MPEPPTTSDYALDPCAGLAKVQAAIADRAQHAGRAAGQVTLIAISKTHGAEAIVPVLRAGHRVFGENRVQEAAAKWPALRAEFPGIELHLVGPLQTNKARDAVALFDVIETVDRPKLAGALAREMTRSGLRPRCYIQVNTGEEAQKAGIAPGDADGFIALCRDQIDLPVEGLMCIPPANEDPVSHFALLKEIAGRNNLSVLSMGMSGDYEIAVQSGATHVRVGTAIFGNRGH